MAVLVLAILLGPLPPTQAQTAAPSSRPTTAPCGEGAIEPCGEGDGSNINFGDSDGGTSGTGTSGTSGGATSNGPGRPPRPLPEFVTETRQIPTCSSNSVEGGDDALCGAAVGTCPDPLTAYWVFTRTRNTRTGVVTRWTRVSNPPFVCLGGPDAPLPPPVPIEVLISEELEQDFASLPLPRPDVDVRPRGRALINIPTRFFTTIGTQTLAPFQLLGRQVTVTAIAQRYDWNMGDVGPDALYPDAGPGSSERPIEHTYRQPGRVTPTVTITWGGTFTVAGIAGTFTVNGTATTVSAPPDLAAVSARSELVAR